MENKNYPCVFCARSESSTDQQRLCRDCYNMAEIIATSKNKHEKLKQELHKIWNEDKSHECQACNEQSKELYKVCFDCYDVSHLMSNEYKEEMRLKKEVEELKKIHGNDAKVLQCLDCSHAYLKTEKYRCPYGCTGKVLDFEKEKIQVCRDYLAQIQATVKGYR